MTRLYVVRHGEATSEAGGLSARGRDQSRRLAQRLRSEDVVEVRHSPRTRAAETAAILAEALGVPDLADPALDDRTPIPPVVPDRQREWFAAVPADERDEGGVRLTAAVEAFLADDRPLVLVTHAFVAAWFVQHVLAAPPTAWMRLPISNTGLTTFDRPDRVLGVNDVGHTLDR
jgi:serine/threonine-protein phosphatase PGAM5